MNTKAVDKQVSEAVRIAEQALALMTEVQGFISNYEYTFTQGQEMLQQLNYIISAGLGTKEVLTKYMDGIVRSYEMNK